MKIILSKKGFDTSYGGHPSIIDGTRLISMPVPEKDGLSAYSDLYLSSDEKLSSVAEKHYKHIYVDKQRTEFSGNIKCHADPNISNYFRLDNFRGSLGQSDNSLGQSDKAQSHLKGQEVGKGDIFLFYGLFAEAEGGMFVGMERDVLWGYLQIDEVISVQESLPQKQEIENLYPWLKFQPHWRFDNTYKNNTIYIGKNYGIFNYTTELNLTKPYARFKGQWQVKALTGLGLSGTNDGVFNADGCITMPPTFAQEYVIEENDKATQWAESIIKKHIKN
ncbi:MAG: hypothetical protein FWH03_01715 [Firmicutes bacterium]|nr:hypothetical protein [Bacillota bacterium]